MHLNRTDNNELGKTFPLCGLRGLSGEHGKNLIENIPPKLPTPRQAR